MLAAQLLGSAQKLRSHRIHTALTLNRLKQDRGDVGMIGNALFQGGNVIEGQMQVTKLGWREAEVAQIFRRAVANMAPIVRPWKEPVKVMIFGFSMPRTCTA